MSEPRLKVVVEVEPVICARCGMRGYGAPSSMEVVHDPRSVYPDMPRAVDSLGRTWRLSAHAFAPDDWREAIIWLGQSNARKLFCGPCAGELQALIDKFTARQL